VPKRIIGEFSSIIGAALGHKLFSDLWYIAITIEQLLLIATNYGNQGYLTSHGLVIIMITNA